MRHNCAPLESATPYLPEKKSPQKCTSFFRGEILGICGLHPFRLFLLFLAAIFFWAEEKGGDSIICLALPYEIGDEGCGASRILNFLSSKQTEERSCFEWNCLSVWSFLLLLARSFTCDTKTCFWSKPKKAKLPKNRVSLALSPALRK